MRSSPSPPLRWVPLKHNHRGYEQSVKKLLFCPSGNNLMVVVGKGSDYLVSGNSCTCYSHYNKVIKGTIRECVHIQAVKSAMEDGSYELFVLHDEEFNQIFKYLVDESLVKNAPVAQPGRAIAL